MPEAKNAASGAKRGVSGNGWQLAWGILLVLSGVLAVLMPAVAALATPCWHFV